MLKKRLIISLKLEIILGQRVIETTDKNFTKIRDSLRSRGNKNYRLKNTFATQQKTVFSSVCSMMMN